jgi:hypothetical protein
MDLAGRYLVVWLSPEAIETFSASWSRPRSTP